MRTIPMFLTAAALLAAGCVNDDRPPPSGAPPQSDGRPEQRDGSTPVRAEAAAGAVRGTRITVRDSRFGRMLFDSRRQAIYVFQNDGRNRSVCRGECARLWPPVLTKGRPVAAPGVDRAKLGTIRRPDGRLQVTYAGRPLYFYAHEKPGQVLCHNVDLNGGLWWVIGPDGKRRP